MIRGFHNGAGLAPDKPVGTKRKSRFIMELKIED